MANNCETSIGQMMSELNDIKQSLIDANVCDLQKSQIQVLSTDSDKVVINIKLNPMTNELNESSVCDKNDKNEESDKSEDKTDSNTRSGPQSQKSTNDCKGGEDRSGGRSQTPTDQTFKGRSYRRTYSESSNSNEGLNRGILKYSHNWMRRTVSESNCDFDFDIGLDFNILTDFYESIDDIYSDEDYDCERKPKKNVRFSENVSKTIFRPNSSILGRKQKNKKRAKNRKNSNSSQPKSSSDSSINVQNNDKFDIERTRQDSGYDSEDNGHSSESDPKCETHNKHMDRILIEKGVESICLE